VAFLIYCYTNVIDVHCRGVVLRGRADNSDKPKHHRLYFYVYKEVMAVRLDERLSKKQKEQLDRIRSPKKEQFSESEIKHLMGMDKQIYTRKNGAIRNK
jgi:hypothetical protein